MSLIKKSIHAAITLTSFTGFLAGWAFLAQAARQTTQQTTNNSGLQTVANLPPIQSVDHLVHTIQVNSNSNTLQTYTVTQATPTPMPLPTLQPQPQAQLPLFTPPLHTGGS